jgi:hypothetical protein
MIHPFILTEMLGAELADAVLAAQARLSDETVLARGEAGLWLVERAEVVLASGLSHDDAVAVVVALA